MRFSYHIYCLLLFPFLLNTPVLAQEGPQPTSDDWWIQNLVDSIQEWQIEQVGPPTTEQQVGPPTTEQELELAPKIDLSPPKLPPKIDLSPPDQNFNDRWNLKNCPSGYPFSC